MSTQGLSCITLKWLHEIIEKRNKEAELSAHQKFVAASKIQKTYRNWRNSGDKKIQNDKAIIIQKWWRGFLGRKIYYQLLEESLNDRYIKWFNYNATIIQKLWRGYITRLRVYNHSKSKRDQLETMQDIITCIAYKMHHHLRTNQIPGTFSLRNSECLSKVEKLLASLKFSKCNPQLLLKTEKSAQVVNVEKRKEPKEEEKKDAPVPDKFSTSPSSRHKGLRMNTAQESIDSSRKARPKKVKPTKPIVKESVHRLVLESMKRWGIAENVDEYKINHSNLEHFLDDVKSICIKYELITCEDSKKQVCR